MNEIVIPRPKFLGDQSWILKGLSDISIVFGKNGSGKSIMLRQWRDKDKDSTHYVVPERGGEIQFEPGHLADSGTGAGRAKRSAGNLSHNYRQSVIATSASFLLARGAARTNTSVEQLNVVEKLLNIVL